MSYVILPKTTSVVDQAPSISGPANTASSGQSTQVSRIPGPKGDPGPQGPRGPAGPRDLRDRQGTLHSFSSEISVRGARVDSTGIDLGQVDVREYFDQFNITDSSTDDCHDALAAADAAAVAQGRVLSIVGPCKVAQNITLTAMHIDMRHGVLVPGISATVTIAGEIACPRGVQCFDTSEGGSILFDAAAGYPAHPISAAWFGCLKGTDWTVPLQAAIDSIPSETHSGNPQLQVKILLPFSGSITDTITVDRKGVQFEGVGHVGSIASPSGQIGSQIAWAGTSTDVPMIEFLECKYAGARNIQLLGDGTHKPHGILVSSDSSVGTNLSIEFERVLFGAHYISPNDSPPNTLNRALYFEYGADGATGFNGRVIGCRFFRCDYAFYNPCLQQLAWVIQDSTFYRCGVAIESASRMLEENCYHYFNGIEYEPLTDSVIATTTSPVVIQAKHAHMESVTTLVRSLTSGGNGVRYWVDIDDAVIQLADVADNPLLFVNSDGAYDQRVRIRDAKLTDTRSVTNRTNPVEVRMLLPASSGTVEKSFEFEDGWVYNDAETAFYTQDNWQFNFRPSGAHNTDHSVFRFSWWHRAANLTGARKKVEDILSYKDVASDLTPYPLSSARTTRWINGDTLGIGARATGAVGHAFIKCTTTSVTLPTPSGGGPYTYTLAGLLPAEALIIGVIYRNGLSATPPTGSLGVTGATTLWANGSALPNKVHSFSSTWAIRKTGSSAEDLILTISAAGGPGPGGLAGEEGLVTIFYLQMEGPL